MHLGKKQTMSASLGSVTNAVSAPKGGWNKSLLIHIAVELVLFGVAAVFFIRRTNAIQAELDIVKHNMMIQDQRQQEMMRLIQQLYADKPSLPSQPAASQRKQQPKVSFANPVETFEPQQQQFNPPPFKQQQQPIQPPQQQPKQQAPSFFGGGGKSPLDTIMNIMPAIMPAMMGGGGQANIVITELQKPMPRPDVQVVNEDDDPDVEEALKVGGSLSSISEEDEDDEKSA